jgi:hypothetical protein
MLVGCGLVAAFEWGAVIWLVSQIGQSNNIALFFCFLGICINANWGFFLVGLVGGVGVVQECDVDASALPSQAYRW